MYVIETHNLSKVYNGKPAVNKVYMHVPQGSIYGFVGENGSGKTTIMRLLTGLAEPSFGSFKLFGIDNKNKKIYDVRRKTSAIVEATSLVPSMTAIDNMKYQEAYLGIKLNDEKRKELLKLVHLENVGKKKVKNFSLGMKQRLGIALALMNEPELMLLDEPMNGLDPQGIVELRELLIELNQKKGLTVLISSHILSELEKIASIYGFISHGVLLEELTVDQLQDKCKKSLTIKVEDQSNIAKVFESLKIDDYKIYPNGDIIIFNELDIASFVAALHSKKIKITSIKSSDENVEDYYLSLVNKGGKK